MCTCVCICLYVVRVAGEGSFIYRLTSTRSIARRRMKGRSRMPSPRGARSIDVLFEKINRLFFCPYRQQTALPMSNRCSGMDMGNAVDYVAWTCGRSRMPSPRGAQLQSTVMRFDGRSIYSLRRSIAMLFLPVSTTSMDMGNAVDDRCMWHGHG